MYETDLLTGDVIQYSSFMELSEPLYIRFGEKLRYQEGAAAKSSNTPTIVYSIYWIALGYWIKLSWQLKYWKLNPSAERHNNICCQCHIKGNLQNVCKNSTIAKLVYINTSTNPSIFRPWSVSHLLTSPKDACSRQVHIRRAAKLTFSFYQCDNSKICALWYSSVIGSGHVCVCVVMTIPENVNS